MIIKSAEFVTSSSDKKSLPEELFPEIVLSGRSNVGKSSFINLLTNRKNLAHTSSKPGKTITLNFFSINNLFYLVDVPGYGYALRSKTQKEKFGQMIEMYFEVRKTLKLVVLLVDLRHKPSNDDVTMYNYVKHYDHDVLIVATKKDKVKKNDIQKNLKMIKETLNTTDKIIPISIVTKEGIEEVKEYINLKLDL